MILYSTVWIRLHSVSSLAHILVKQEEEEKEREEDEAMA